MTHNKKSSEERKELVRHPSRDLAIQLCYRNKNIIKLRKKGWKQHRIANLYGISTQRVEQIVNNRKYFNKYIAGYNRDDIKNILLERSKTNGISRPIFNDIDTMTVTDITGIKSGARERFRELIRLRDNHTCQWCMKQWSPGHRRFDIHHIIGGKEDTRKCGGNPDEMITLCHKCHLNIDGYKIAKSLNKMEGYKCEAQNKTHKD